MKIYVVLYSAFDGECSYDRPIKAFTKKDDADEHAKLCTEECQRIQSEVDTHNEKYKDELEMLNKKIRDIILAGKGKKKIVLREVPESIRSVEIYSKKRAIIQTHKHDPHFMVLDDDHYYIVEELELD